MLFSVFFVVLPLFFGSCAAQPPYELSSEQKLYCDAPWVSRVKILSRSIPENSDSDSVTHKVNFPGIWKVPAGMVSLPGELKTPSEGSNCSLTLLSGKEYFLIGTIKENILYSNLCDQFYTTRRPADSKINSGGDDLYTWGELMDGYLKQLFTDRLEAFKGC